jgi:peptidyl-prolyl cis-trans isomerase D
LYEEQRANYGVGEERRAKHILIKVEEDANDQAIEAARTKAQDILSKIRTGEDFEKLAKKYSEDAGSAADGGDLGYFARGVMVKPFEDAAFSMSVDEVSDLVRSPFGFHIIKLVGIKSGHTKSFDEVRAQLEQGYKERKAEEEFFEQADLLTDLTYENPDTLSVASQELNLPIITTGLFTRNNGQGIASDPKIRETAFSTDVLEARNNSEPIDLGQNRLLVLRIKERKMASTRPQNEVRDQIISQLQRDKAKQAAVDAGEALLQRIIKGENVELIADELKLEWKKTGFIGRTDTSVSPDIVRAAFKMQKPQSSSPVNKGVELTSGDYAIITVYEVKDGDPSAVDKAARESLRTSVLRSNGQQISNSVFEGLKQRAKITEYPDRL